MSLTSEECLPFYVNVWGLPSRCDGQEAIGYRSIHRGTREVKEDDTRTGFAEPTHSIEGTSETRRLARMPVDDRRSHAQGSTPTLSIPEQMLYLLRNECEQGKDGELLPAAVELTFVSGDLGESDKSCLLVKWGFNADGFHVSRESNPWR